MTIGERIRERRKYLGMTQLELAVKVGCSSKSTITKIERNDRSIPYKRLSDFAKALDTTVSWLAGEEEKPNEKEEKSSVESIIIESLTSENKDRLISYYNFLMKSQNEELLS